MHRIFGVLFLAAASASFAQIAPVTHSSPRPRETPVLAMRDGDEPNAEDSDVIEVPQVVAQAQAEAAQQGSIAATRPTPVMPRVVAPPPPAQGPNSRQEMVKLQFPNSDVGDVLRFYESLTGKRLIKDNFVTGKVDIFLNRDVPRDEAIKIIEISLLLNGYALIPAEGDLVKVIGTGKNPRTTG
ncbi:MAG TPA: hypothetical protein VEH26_05650, partial [Chthoniobacterales bacterium]|nr:hypothetical protein [Chthoniobacterales bacterium]